jgi:hypothetical protein
VRAMRETFGIGQVPGADGMNVRFGVVTYLDQAEADGPYIRVGVVDESRGAPRFLDHLGSDLTIEQATMLRDKLNEIIAYAIEETYRRTTDG